MYLLKKLYYAHHQKYSEGEIAIILVTVSELSDSDGLAKIE